MSIPRYLTKSRFKLASECPTKLFYTGKNNVYANQKIDDPFLMALAKGGFQVGELAKCYFPGGIEVKAGRGDYESALSQTDELLLSENVTIFEAAIRYRKFFIRVDVLVKIGNQLELIEVKSKSYREGESQFFGKTGKSIDATWKPYLYDVAFQKHVVLNAFPDHSVSAYLMLADKASFCPTDGLNQKFRVKTGVDDQKYVELAAELTAEEIHPDSWILRKVPVDNACDQIFAGTDMKLPDANPHKHKFFQILGRKNDRMQHLTTMTRFLLIEEAGGYADLKDSAVVDFIVKHEVPDGIGNYSLENRDFAKACLRNLNEFFSIFENDPMWDENNGIKELGREYLTISLYFLVRHLRHNYVIGDPEKDLIRRFFYEFYARWYKGDQDDNDIERFSNRRQQSKNDLQERDIIFRQLFFDFLTKENAELLTIDKKRAFNEAERIRIYRRDNGLCQHCIAEGKPESEAQVSWTQYQADHILAHAMGGETAEENAQVLCQYHNAKKGKSPDIAAS